MADPTTTIETLYAALATSDGAAMAGCYAPGATFQDPAFGQLRGPEVGAMWRMLTSRASAIEVELHEHAAAGLTGTAHWVATYAFGPQKRSVVNDIRATYRFTPQGLILEHIDRFDLGRWAAQAMGPIQGLLGRMPILGLLIHRTTRRQLDTFMAAEGN